MYAHTCQSVVATLYRKQNAKAFSTTSRLIIATKAGADDAMKKVGNFTKKTV